MEFINQGMKPLKTSAKIQLFSFVTVTENVNNTNAVATNVIQAHAYPGSKERLN